VHEKYLPMTSAAACHFCHHEFSVEASERRFLPRVTSDCRPAARTGALAVCPSCCLTQTIVDDDWRAAAEAAYREYAIYEAGGGAEQKVASGSGLQSRSKVLVDRLVQRQILPSSGTWLDFGCGNGGFLRAFAERFPSWQLEGAETDQRYLADLQSIAGFRRLHGVDTGQLSGSYVGVSLVHVLEHIATPTPVLASLRGRVAPGGFLFIEVPSWRTNPFALMIADHASHFTPATLQMVVNASGWTAEAAREDWVPKELSLVARNGDEDGVAGTRLDYLDEKEALHSAVRWLAAVMGEAQQVALGSANFGLFGSAIAATWLYQSMSDRVRFFVDEDPQRVGRTHLGLPILSPEQVPAEADVFVGVSPTISGKLMARLQSGRGRYRAVSSLPPSGIASVC
jgi:SAM-dependent methyltransferase